MDFFELVKNTRSVRAFDPAVRLSHEELLKIVDCARLSPSSMNLQMLKLRLIETAEECRLIFPLTRWAGRIKDQQIPPEGHEPTSYILICADLSVSPAAESFQKDVGIVAEAMMLATGALGFGGCMIGSFQKEEMARTLALPDHLRPQLLLALGKPAEKIILTEAVNGEVGYYRKDGTHFVPKRSLSDLMI